MRIVMFTNTYTPIVGGVERSITSFTRAFRRMGHEVLIVTLEFDNMPEHEEGVVRIPAIRHFNGSDFSIRLPIPVNLKKVLDRFQPEIVHSHHPFILGDTALRVANDYQIPLVFTHHTKYEDYTHYVPLDSPAMKKFVIELTTGYAELADHVIAPSQSIYDLLMERKVKTPISVVPTGVDIDAFCRGDGRRFRKTRGIRQEEFLLGHVGRLAPEKNLAFLTRCVVRFLRERPSAKFLLVGKGVLSEEIRFRFQKEGLEERLVAPGVLEGEALMDAYRAMDLFVFSSKTETQGMVLLEAMAASVPVVALAASGVNDVLKDEVNGRVVLNEDEEEFITAIQWVHDQPRDRKEALRQEAFRVARTMSMDQMALKMLGIYQSLREEDFVYCDIDNSLWAKAVGRLKIEWELLTNLAEAVGSVFKDRFSRPARESWLQKAQRWLNPNEWSARLSGLFRSEGTENHPGVVFIQIDGLAFDRIREAMKKGKMPFVQRLLKKEKYTLTPFYSGQPSSTPGVQAELFYGVKGAVPSFSFLDHASGEVFRMYNVEAAEAMERRLSAQHTGLLAGGSSYSNIYSGGARETHFCAVDLGWDRLWREIKPVRLALIGILNVSHVLKTCARLGIELISSLVDFLDGLRKGETFIKELKFIPTRLGICILLRDLMTFGAKIDIIRGLPVVHVNFIGYDEHAHRRGPSSSFAYWTLKGIDRSIRKIYLETLRSQRRAYDVWIYSDHGQEAVRSYWKTHGRSVQQAVQEVLKEFSLSDNYPDHYRQTGEQYHRAHFSGPAWLKKLLVFRQRPRDFPKKEDLVVTAMGPVGHVYLPLAVDDEEKDRLARRLVSEARIPLVFALDKEQTVLAWTPHGRHRLPEDAGAVFGEDHPFLKEVTEDMTRTCRHPDAGTFTISGWDPREQSWSFPLESGAHGGPGRDETKGFALLPEDIFLRMEKKAFVRAGDLRQGALMFMGREERSFVEGPGPDGSVSSQENKRFLPEGVIRVMTYNVHGCKGMDGRISPERIARVIAKCQPDIVALQELDMHRLRSGTIDQPHVIAKALEMDYHFCPAMAVEEERYGNAILSRFPMSVREAKGLPGMGARQEPRGALWVTVHTPQGPLQMINTHLGLNRRERLEQIQALLGEEWMGHPECATPLLLVGDFNALPGSRECQRIKAVVRDAQEEMDGHRPLATWWGRFPLRRIDHVFVSEDVEVRNVEVSRTRMDRVASDHLPLVVDVVLPSASGHKGMEEAR